MKSASRIVSVMLLALLCGLLTPGVYSQTPAEQDDEVIRVDTDLTSLFFIASDRNNRYITSLRQEDLRLTEDGLPQTIVTFQRETDRPLSIAFLIDVSASEERTLPEEKAAARGFIETVIQSSKDQAAIIAFTGSAYLEQDLTRDVLSLYRALERVEVAMPAYLGAGRPISGIFSAPGTKRPPIEGTTAIWEAVALTASRVLTPSPNAEVHNQKRRAIILLTDGWDTSSRLNMSEAISFALSAETVIYAIGVGDSKMDGVDKHSLETVAESTGGRAFFPKKEADLKNAFAEIERELRSQYLVAYSSTNKRRDGSYRHIRLDVTSPVLQKDKLRLRYRPGYYAKPLLPPASGSK
jgi:Ca-activated chloride channel family protein